MEGHSRGDQDLILRNSRRFQEDLESPGLHVRVPGREGVLARKTHQDASQLMTLHPDEIRSIYFVVRRGQEAVRPIMRSWTYLRLNFDHGTFQEDLRAFLRHSTWQLWIGKGSLHGGSCSAMQPYLPRGGAREVKGLIKDGTIQSWPWLEARFGPAVVAPSEEATFTIVPAPELKLRYPVTFRASLGPHYLELT